MSKNTFFIIDDDPVLTTAVEHAILLAEPKAIVHKFTSAERALGNNTLKPSIIFLDHYLDHINGIASIPVILKVFPDAAIAVVSGQDDIEVFAEAYKNGADTYFKKDKFIVEKITRFVKNKCLPEIEKGYFEKLTEAFKTKTSTKNSAQRVVMIDDDRLTAFAIQYPLRNLSLLFENYTDVKSFLSSPIKQSPDIILLDLFLENRNVGPVDLFLIKEKHPKSKIIILSTNKDIDIAEEMLEKGADYYMSKSKESLGRLNKVLVEMK